MANFKVDDQVKDLAGATWTITRVSIDPGERQTYYNIRKGKETGFVWESTLSRFIAKKLDIHSCDITEEDGLKEPCDACAVERAQNTR